MLLKIKSSTNMLIFKCDSFNCIKKKDHFFIDMVDGREVEFKALCISVYDNGHLIEHKDIKEEL